MLNMKVNAGVEYSLPLFLSLTLDGGKWSASCPNVFNSGASASYYPLNKRLGGPQSQLGAFEKRKYVSPPIHKWNDSSVVQQFYHSLCSV
jgi:hypothetical protein